MKERNHRDESSSRRGGPRGKLGCWRNINNHAATSFPSSIMIVLLVTVSVFITSTVIPKTTVVQAFVPVRENHHRYMSKNTILQTSSSSSSNNRLLSDDILENEKGKINPELAQRLWKWEQEQRLNLQILGDYSTRRGLRWVKDLVHEWDDSSISGVKPTKPGSGAGGSDKGSDDTSAADASIKKDNYEDLIQEGMMALMQSLKSFEHSARPDESFEKYAKDRIKLALDSYMLEREKGTGETLGRKETHRHPLSMESTVAVMADPLESHNYYFNQDEWEKREGLILDDGKSSHRDELVEEFLDENLKSEGDDQMWVHEQQVAAPLRESIPEDASDNDEYDDDEDHDDPFSFVSSPENVFLQDMLLHNVDNFLGQSSLDDTEIQLIQMQFGLDDGVPKPQKEIAWELDLTVNQVRRMRKQALKKLRDEFTKKYVDDDQGSRDEDMWEDTP
mmetsp:Transcript_47019/g.114731  ORF Transcript_47019/g.114731 Transcript_47019/m.114731 type:complete len:449 (+) Transcript_47019:266-1612(+)